MRGCMKLVESLVMNRSSVRFRQAAQMAPFAPAGGVSAGQKADGEPDRSDWECHSWQVT